MFYITLLMAATLLNFQKENNHSYAVKKIQTDFQINGKGDNAVWKTANELTDFIYPWEKEKAPPLSFRALHSKDWLYLFYDVKDDDIKIFEDKHDKTDVLNSDRVEIFFKQEDNKAPYYGLEMDPLGRVYDYQVSFFRKFNAEWSWPAGQLNIRTARTVDGYSVEVAISRASLIKLSLLKDKTLHSGVFRGKCIKINGQEADFKWISWVKPDSATPDFHIPSSFGVLLLED